MSFQRTAGPGDRRLTDKICVITGATSGIGLCTAMQLAAMGARLVLIGRDRGRGEVALALLKSRCPQLAVEIHYADLSRLDEIRRLGQALTTLPQIDVLINNAGAIFSRREVTEDGLERTFALNHMAYFLLTELLLDRIKQSAPARIVNVTSELHRLAKVDFSDLQSEHLYSGWRAYCRSKLCNVLFTRELARQLGRTGVTVNCLHPGFVASRFADNNKGIGGWSFWTAKTLFGSSPVWGATATAYLASAPEVAGTTGAYFRRYSPSVASPIARDDRTAARLWHETARLAGL